MAVSTQREPLIFVTNKRVFVVDGDEIAMLYYVTN